MKRDEVIHLLRSHLADLHQTYGVKSLALFGSVARDQAQPGSDVDILEEFDGQASLFVLFRLQDYLESLLNCKVDLGTRHSLKPRLRDNVLREIVDVT